MQRVFVRAVCVSLYTTSALAVTVRQASRKRPPLRMYVYPVSVKDFDIDAGAIEKYNRWLDMSVTPVPHGIRYVESDIEQNHVLHNPYVGLAATAKSLGLTVDKPEEANVFWLPISNVILCLAAYKPGENRLPIISKKAYTCKAYYSILEWLFKQESWLRNQGADHVFDIDQVPLGFEGLDNESMHKALEDAFANSIIITKEDRSIDAIRRIRSSQEIIVPYYVPRGEYGVPDIPKKTRLVSFIGSEEVECHVENCVTWNSRAIRKRILEELHASSHAAIHDLGLSRLPSAFDASSAADTYSKSTFCVVPAGDSFSSARLFAVLLASCIPVNINDQVQLPFNNTLPMRWDDFSVMMREAEVLQYGVLPTLRKLSKDKALISKMQKAGSIAASYLSYSGHKVPSCSFQENAQIMILQEIKLRVRAWWDACQD